MQRIEGVGSVSVVGLAKNAGKTETLNYLLRGLCRGGAHPIGVTSIGVDGESEDSVHGTVKPSIALRRGTVFVTSERHYRQRRLVSEILDVSATGTSLGRLVTARVVEPGTVILSGPATTSGLKTCIDAMTQYGVETTLVDGALSRLSLASPAVTDAMILATGAAVARSIPEVVRKTKFVCDLIRLPLAGEIYDLCNGSDSHGFAVQSEAIPGRRTATSSGHALASDCKMESKKSEICEVSRRGSCRNEAMSFSGFFDFRGADFASSAGESEGAYSNVRNRTSDKEVRKVPHTNRKIFEGMLGDKALETLRVQPDVADMVVVAQDFTRIFASPETFYAFLRKGGRIAVERRPVLLGVTINPTSPDGYTLDAGRLKHELELALDVPVYNVKP